jgi:hypothetical protein
MQLATIKSGINTARTVLVVLLTVHEEPDPVVQEHFPIFGNVTKNYVPSELQTPLLLQVTKA